MTTLEKEITIAEDNRKIKRALKNAFPYYQIIIRNGRGTAYGWKKVFIITDIPERINSEGFYSYNEEEKEKFEEIRTLANNIIHGVGKRIYNYCADDGYNSKTSMVSLSVDGCRL
jgi:hypothetical protein